MTFGKKMRYFTDFVLLSYATGMILTYDVYFKMQMKKIFCPILFDIESDKYDSCIASNGFWMVLFINIFIIPVVFQTSLSKMAYFSAFSIIAMSLGISSAIN